jgi:hypothetical protein
MAVPLLNIKFEVRVKGILLICERNRLVISKLRIGDFYSLK